MATRIWVTWEEQRRNKELSKALHAAFFELKEIDRIDGKITKYSMGIIKTIAIILHQKPKLVFCQNPSIVLSLLMVCLSKVLGFKIVVDAHNAGIYPAEGNSAFLMKITRFIQKHSSLVLVSNEGLQHHVEKNGGRAFVLQDKIPTILSKKTVRLAGRVNFLFICSYAVDEPYELVFEAAHNLPKDIAIYVTGAYEKKGLDQERLPDQVHLTGFISNAEFEELLCSVDATIDLTDREDCLVCGAYESVAVEKPMILSNTSALRSYFMKGAIYTDHTVAAISSSILKMERDMVLYKNQVIGMKKHRTESWKIQAERLESLLIEICPEASYV